VTLDGGFIQLDNDALKLTPDEWKQLVGQMNALGMRYLIVQSLGKTARGGEASDFLYPSISERIRWFEDWGETAHP
jgi:hypothetical protein